MFYAICVLLLLSLILLCCFFKKIEVLIVILKCSARFVNENMTIILVPPVFYVILIVWFIFWMVGAVYLYTVGEIDEKSSLPFGQFIYDKKTKYFMWIYLFGLFWGFAFLLAY